MKYSRMEEDDRLFEARPKEPGLSYVFASIWDGKHFYSTFFVNTILNWNVYQIARQKIEDE